MQERGRNVGGGRGVKSRCNREVEVWSDKSIKDRCKREVDARGK